MADIPDLNEVYAPIPDLNEPPPMDMDMDMDMDMEDGPLAAQQTFFFEWFDLQNPASPPHFSSVSLDLELARDLFLKNCFACKKFLEMDEDTYFIRDKTFCSEECSYQEWWFYDQEERRKQALEEEEQRICSDYDSGTRTDSSPRERVIFYIGDVPKGDQPW